jgi:hypothetical protein
MKRRFLLIQALFVMLAIPLCAFAQAEAAAPRSPGDMSVEERMGMMKTASKYDNCIYSQAIARADDFADIRQAADFAMGACQDKLTDLEESIQAMGFGSDFAIAFSKRVRRRAVRKILPELAIRKSGG